ncbi:MAG: glycosyltransferase [Thermoleophilia bacterium]|nr:glycosyltransferase [Thermoleophilia bacterium]
MSEQTPAVSVLMAVHDGERHLREAVESILGQTFADFELVVVDDASTDASRSILEGYGDPRIRLLVNRENLGLTRSLNRGLAATSGRYVARHDADDVSEPDRLALQVAHLDRNPEHALVASAYRRIDDEGRESGHRPVPLTTCSIRWRLLFLNAFTHSSVTLRRSIVVGLGGYDESVHYPQDYELWSRIAERHEVAALPQRLVSYRRSASSMTTARAASEADDEVAAISRRNVDRVLPGMGTRLDREAAWRLLFANARGVRPRRAVRTSRDVLALQAAFARHYRLSRREAVAHRGSVALALARGGRRALAASRSASERA